ncbi:MAG: choice-of-anchor D domain-containing protein [Streptosporangiaceae bacterium]|nr:choice-of-anchor D domain-containing protein [Streptosporangiaceae bacterium]
MHVRTRAWPLAMLMALMPMLAGAPPGPSHAGNPPEPADSPTLALTSIGTNGRPMRAPSPQAVIAPGGRYAAFQEGSGIYVRDLAGGTTTLLSDPAHGSATAPDISADGRLVSYEQGGQVYVTDRRARQERQVTGTVRDPRGAHVVPCPAALGSGRVTPCGPRLSADGTTLVYPAEISPVSPELSITATLGEPTDVLTGDMLDYGPARGTAAVRFENNGSEPVRFTSVTVSGQPFELGQGSCADPIAPGSSCTVTVSFDPAACDDTFFATGRLSTASPDPAGQSTVELTGMCFSGVEDAAYRSCPVPSGGLTVSRAPALTRDIEGAPVSDAGDAEVGRPHVIWLPVSVPDEASGSVAVLFAGADCGIQLVDPAGLKLAGPLPAGAPAPCSEGEQLSGSSSCTAYLLINPEATTPDAAFLGTCSEQQNIAPTAFVTARGVQHIIVARHDPSGTGDFAASASTIVSAGIPDAIEPSVSADGRYIGFAADGQVWLHDTRRGGRTTLVAAAGAGSPSVSGDGQRVAFASSGRVYVRSVTARTTVLVSAAGYAPVISLNATTVGYVSRGRLYLALATNGPGAAVAAGTAIGMPSLDAIGRLATFPATGPLLPDSPPGIASVYTFDLRPRLSPSPAHAGFGAVLMGSGTRAIAVTVTDSGPGPGTVTGVRTTGPFLVTGNRCTGMVLYAGGHCAVTVTFTPSAPSRAGGMLTVTTQDDGEPPVSAAVPVTASVPAPAVTATPGVASSGNTVLASGTGFPPGQRVTLTWRPGLGSAVAAASGSGTFEAYLVIFPDDAAGPRALIAAGPDGALARSAVLVQRGPVEPPFTPR